MVALVRRYARTHGPFPTGAARAAATASTLAARCASWSAPGELVRGELLPGGTEREWCDSDVLRRVRRASLAHLRAEAEAVEPRELARLPAQLAERRCPPAGRGRPDRLREALVPLQGVALTPEVWERDVLPRRLGAYSPAWLDELCTGGEFVWIGAGALGRSGGKVALYFREDVRLAGPPPANAEARAARRATATTRSASCLGLRPCFWLDLVDELDLDRRGAAHGSLGPRLGRRGDERRLRAAARAAAARASQRSASSAAGASRPAARPPARPCRAVGPSPRRCSRTRRRRARGCERRRS